MDYIDKTTNGETEKEAIKKVLDESLNDDDFYCRKSLGILGEMGIDKEKALTLLAHHKSGIKYGYDLSPKSLSHLFKLVEKEESDSALKRLSESPFFLVKSCWLFEHAPFFFFYDELKPEGRDSLLIEFAEKYETNFLKNRVDTGSWQKVKNPWRLKAATFWENMTFDPLLLIERVKKDNVEGIEISFDFHPFNYTTLLPEEIGPERREQIKEACRKSGIKLDIHSPIVGPYTPSPDPSKGKQSFFDPTRCLPVQYDTIELAKDIGAESVVFHLIDSRNLKKMLRLIERAGGSDLRVTVENYCQTRERQTSDMFIACVDDILNSLPLEVREKNFGITLDVGHFNIEGEDPLIASEKIGNWCIDNGVYMRLHATDNYGNLLFSSPAYSADVHSNVSGRGINNSLIIKLLRSMGLRFDVLAEQIQPLTPEDIEVVHNAQTCPLKHSYKTYVEMGKEKLSKMELGAFIEPEFVKQSAYQFVAGIKDLFSLREYLVYRKIQDKKFLSVDEAKRISQDFMKMPQKLKSDLTTYIDDLLLPIQSETGTIQKSELDLICQNITGALYAAVSNEHLNQIFSQEIVYGKGDIICEQNSAAQEMYYVKEGEVNVSIEGSLVAILGPGEIFGEMSLFYNIKRSATIQAAKDKTKIGVLSRRALENLFKKSEPYASELIYRLYNILPDRLRNLNDKYKTAIRTLHLIFEGDEKEIPELDYLQEDFSHKEVDFFPTLTQIEKKKIYGKVESYRPGEVIFAEGDKGEGAYFVLEGEVKVVASSKNSKEIILGKLKRGEIAGEMALIDDKPRSATILALTPCKMAFISKKTFGELTRTRSELGLRLMGFICLSLFRRILRLDEIYSDIKRRIKV